MGSQNEHWTVKKNIFDTLERRRVPVPTELLDELSVIRGASIREPIETVRTFVTDDAVSGLPAGLDKHEPLAPRHGRVVDNFQFSKPSDGSTSRPRTVGVPGADAGVPYKNDYDTPTRRTMKGRGDACSPATHSYAWVSPDGHAFVDIGDHGEFSGYHVKKDPALRRKYEAWKASKSFGHGPSTFLMEEGWLRITNIFTIQSNFLPSFWSAKAIGWVIENMIKCVLRNRKDPENVEVRFETPKVSRILSVADFIETYGIQPQVESLYEGLSGSLRLAWKQRWRPGVRQRRQRGMAKVKSHQYYIRNRSKIRMRQKRYRNRFKNHPARRMSERRRRSQNRRRIGSVVRRFLLSKNASVLTVPDIAFVIGKDFTLGYVHSVSPLTGLVTYNLDGSNISQLASLPVEVFLRAAILLTEEDLDAFLNLVDTEIGLEAYEDLDEEGLEECASLYGVDMKSEDFLDLCTDLAGTSDLTSLSSAETDLFGDLVLDQALGHSVEDALEGDETIPAEYDPDLFFGEVEEQKLNEPIT